MSAVLVEFLGTLLLVGTVAFAHNPLLIVAALAVAITFGGKISGGHFNPAITAFSFMTGKTSQLRALSYAGAQLSAALVIGLLSKVI